MPFEMDAWGVDVALTGSQKGLMCPPGLSFVAAGPKADKAHETAELRTNYTDWTFRQGPEHYQKYCGTPPEHLLFAFHKALDLIFEEGLEKTWHRHAFWARQPGRRLRSGRKRARSTSTSPTRMPARTPSPLCGSTKATWRR